MKINGITILSTNKMRMLSLHVYNNTRLKQIATIGTLRDCGFLKERMLKVKWKHRNAIKLKDKIKFQSELEWNEPSGK